MDFPKLEFNQLSPFWKTSPPTHTLPNDSLMRVVSHFSRVLINFSLSLSREGKKTELKMSLYFQWKLGSSTGDTVASRIRVCVCVGGGGNRGKEKFLTFSYSESIVLESNVRKGDFRGPFWGTPNLKIPFQRLVCASLQIVSNWTRDHRLGSVNSVHPFVTKIWIHWRL